MTDLEFIESKGWKYCGILYRNNGDGFGHFRNGSGQRAAVGARESCWDGKSSFKKAVISAFARRIKEETQK